MVDDGSTDASAEIAGELRRARPALPPDPPGQRGARQRPQHGRRRRQRRAARVRRLRRRRAARGLRAARRRARPDRLGLRERQRAAARRRPHLAVAVPGRDVRAHAAEDPRAAASARCSPTARRGTSCCAATSGTPTTLRFPEGVLHEDIPVTLPAHVMAGSVDVLAEPVYHWRIRGDGAARSPSSGWRCARWSTASRRSSTSAPTWPSTARRRLRRWYDQRLVARRPAAAPRPARRRRRPPTARCSPSTSPRCSTARARRCSPTCRPSTA